MVIKTHNGRKTLRLTTAVFLVLSMLGAMLVANAAAGTGTCIAVESVEADAGDTVTVYVNISGNTGISNFDFVVTYDDALQLESVTNKGYLCSSGLFVSNPNYGYIIWAKAVDVTDSEGSLFALTFTVDESAAPGDYNISIGIKDGGALGSEAGAVAADFADGKITVGGGASGTPEGGTLGGNTSGDNTQSGSANTVGVQEGNSSSGNGNSTAGTRDQGTNVPAVPVEITFTDVHEGTWYYNGIRDMTVAGVVNGYDDHTFRPLAHVTCVEVLKLILLASGYDLENSTTGYWAENYYNFALATGLVDSNVELNNPISRVDIAHILADANGIQPDNGPSPFDDVDDPIVTALYNIGLMQGYGNGQFGPDDMLTRAEMTMIVWRLYGYVSTGTIPG